MHAETTHLAPPPTPWLDALHRRWLECPERAAWLVRCTRTTVDAAGRLTGVFVPSGGHARALCERLCHELGGRPPDWDPVVVWPAVGLYLRGVGEPGRCADAVIEIAEWWRFIARLERRPSLTRLAARIESGRLIP